MRINYSSDINLYELCENKDPFIIFSLFFEEAKQNPKIVEANTMFISTCSDNLPSLRPVLLKEIKDDTFVFFTNYESKKSS